MKIQRLERLRQLQLEYHRSHPWRLSASGLYIPHSYAEMSSTDLSYWDDVGFILNGRRIIVWWQHPRYVYAQELEHQVWETVGPGPQDDRFFGDSTKIYKTVGKSRKKVIGYRTEGPSEARKKYYDELRAAEKALQAVGIDFSVLTSWKWERLSWAMGVTLIAPMEIRNETELASMAHLARKLILGETTLQEKFPGYAFDRTQWLIELPKKD